MSNVAPTEACLASLLCCTYYSLSQFSTPWVTVHVIVCDAMAKWLILTSDRQVHHMQQSHRVLMVTSRVSLPAGMCSLMRRVSHVSYRCTSWWGSGSQRKRRESRQHRRRKWLFGFFMFRPEKWVKGKNSEWEWRIVIFLTPSLFHSLSLVFQWLCS